MSRVIPFEKCIARPEDNGKIFWLRDHLIGVRGYVEQRLMLQDTLILKLVGLAGICHDVAKAHFEWQEYIKGFRKRGPCHAPEGAFIFSFLSYQFLKKLKKWDEYKLYWLWLTRDIADHHGALKKICDKQWIRAGEWNDMDLKGITLFIHEQYPEFADTTISDSILGKWTEEVFDVFEDAEDKIDLGYNRVSALELMEKLEFWRELTTSFIAGDRFDVSATETIWFDLKDHISNNQAIDFYCSINVSENLSDLRNKAQQEILRQLADNSIQRMYTLEMPTGYGKTITALKIATWLGTTQGRRKIVYVAPYISILEQNSIVMEEALNVSVMEHHSLAILDKEDSDVSCKERIASGQMAMESWASAIVCTSFQQLSKALFPCRAQDLLRRAYLKDSVVIIDEPQIFNPESWNLFLCGLEALAMLYNLQIIFLSATMPPFEYGLSHKPMRLFVKADRHIERYRIVRYPKIDEKEADEKWWANFLLSRKEKSQAAILNTISDAYLVYNEIKNKDVQCHRPYIRLLHGMMIPLHKRIEILKTHEKLKQIKESQNEQIIVISTQILEAGVNLSFQHIARALPIIPSIVQAAGRVNRHFEGIQGVLSLLPFVRRGGKNTRSFIYDENLQKLTDKLLGQKEVWQESEMLQLIEDYYRRMFENNTFEACKEAIYKAFEGDWMELSKYQPFGNDHFKLPIFVPWHIVEDDHKWLPEKFKQLQRRINLFLPESIYQFYEDKKRMTALTFDEHREFMILFNHFVINVPFKLACTLVDKEIYLKSKIPILEDTKSYNQATGLAQRYVEGFNQFI